MKRSRLFRFAVSSACLLWLLGFGLATANETTLATTITNGNSRFVLTHTDSIGPTPGGVPVTGEWFVDGRRILTYVSIPASQIDIEKHHHSGSHVTNNQLHAQGQLSPAFGWPKGISGGVVYTVNGGAPGSGTARLTEVVELTLGPGITTPQTFNLVGFGFKPGGGHDFEIPDLTGLHVTGTTVTFASRDFISFLPFVADLTTRFRAFVGFNTFSQTITLKPGSGVQVPGPGTVTTSSTLRMITELIVSPAK